MKIKQSHLASVVALIQIRNCIPPIRFKFNSSTNWRRIVLHKSGLWRTGKRDPCKMVRMCFWVRNKENQKKKELTCNRLVWKSKTVLAKTNRKSRFFRIPRNLLRTQPSNSKRAARTDITGTQKIFSTIGNNNTQQITNSRWPTPTPEHTGCNLLPLPCHHTSVNIPTIYDFFPERNINL